MIEPKVYAKIKFNKLRNKLAVLPGDQIKVKFTTSYSDQNALILYPEIYSEDMPSPLKEKFQALDENGDILETLPCDDTKVADTIVCEDYDVYCSDPDDLVIMAI